MKNTKGNPSNCNEKTLESNSNQLKEQKSTGKGSDMSKYTDSVSVVFGYDAFLLLT